jgi:hypothetical protein
LNARYSRGGNKERKKTNMKLVSLETTPNPSCMKLNLDEQIVDKPVSLFSGKSLDHVPQAVLKLLEIEGVKEAFLAPNFITLTRKGQSDWQLILSEAARMLGVAEKADLALLDRPTDPDASPKAETGNKLGFVEIAVLVFRGIPTQVRVRFMPAFGETRKERKAGYSRLGKD